MDGKRCYCQKYRGRFPPIKRLSPRKRGNRRVGVTPLFSRHTTEWDVDLLFKKRWTLSKKVDFMIGVGPQWVHTREYGVTTNSVSSEAVLDFMFWPSAKHRIGWYVEPGY
jgi:hypothetical protein